jgi:hypothetical protein
MIRDGLAAIVEVGVTPASVRDVPSLAEIAVPASSVSRARQLAFVVECDGCSDAAILHGDVLVVRQGGRASPDAAVVVMVARRHLLSRVVRGDNSNQKEDVPTEAVIVSKTRGCNALVGSVVAVLRSCKRPLCAQPKVGSSAT